MAHQTRPLPPIMESQPYPGIVPPFHGPLPPPLLMCLPGVMYPVFNNVYPPPMNPEAFAFANRGHDHIPPQHTLQDQRVIDDMPLRFFSDLPAHRPAVFSTLNGKKPFRHLPRPIPDSPRIMRSDLSADITQKILVLKKEFNTDLIRNVDEPMEWGDLYKYFDAMAIFTEGPDFLYRVIAQMARDAKIIDKEFWEEAKSVIETFVQEWVDQNQELLIRHQALADFVKLFDELDCGHFKGMRAEEETYMREAVNRLGRKFIQKHMAEQQPSRPPSTVADMSINHVTDPLPYGANIAPQPAAQKFEDPRYLYAHPRVRSGSVNVPNRDENASLQARPRVYSNNFGSRRDFIAASQLSNQRGPAYGGLISNMPNGEPVYALTHQAQQRIVSEPTLQTQSNLRHASNSMVDGCHQSFPILPMRPPLPSGGFNPLNSRVTSYGSTGTVKDSGYPNGASAYSAEPNFGSGSYHNESASGGISSRVSSGSSMNSTRPNSFYAGAVVIGWHEGWPLYHKPSAYQMDLGPRYFDYLEGSSLQGVTRSGNRSRSVHVKGVDQRLHFFTHQLKHEMERCGRVAQITYLSDNTTFVNFTEESAIERVMQLFNNPNAPFGNKLVVDYRRTPTNSPDRYSLNNHSTATSTYGSPQRGQYSNYSRPRRNQNFPMHSRQSSLSRGLPGQPQHLKMHYQSAMTGLQQHQTTLNHTPFGRVENIQSYRQPGNNPFLGPFNIGYPGSPNRIMGADNSGKQENQPMSPSRPVAAHTTGIKNENQRPAQFRQDSSYAGNSKKGNQGRKNSKQSSSKQPTPTDSPTKSRSVVESSSLDPIGDGLQTEKQSEQSSPTEILRFSKKPNPSNKKKKKPRSGSNPSSVPVSRAESSQSFSSNATMETLKSTVFDTPHTAGNAYTDTSFSTNTSRKPSVDDETTAVLEITPRPTRQKQSPQKGKGSEHDKRAQASASNPSQSQDEVLQQVHAKKNNTGNKSSQVQDDTHELGHTKKSTPSKSSKAQADANQQGHTKKNSIGSKSSVRKNNAKIPKADGNKSGQETISGAKKGETQVEVSKQTPKSPEGSAINIQDQVKWPSLGPPLSPASNIADGKRPPPINEKQNSNVRPLSSTVDKVKPAQATVAVPKAYLGKPIDDFWEEEKRPGSEGWPFVREFRRK